MYSLLAALGRADGDPPAGNPRRVLPMIRSEPTPGRGGSYEAAVPREAVARTLRRFHDYRIFSVIRDPFDRIVSNYHNKLNRFARRFAPALYAASYIAPAISRLRTVTSVERIRWVQRHVPFDDFVERLGVEGVSWDVHVRPQVQLLALDAIRYERLIPMEELLPGLRQLLAAGSAGERARGALGHLGRWNASSGLREVGPWTARTRALVGSIYAADLDQLGYAVRRAA
ncbi:MAG: sulfotransferase family protein [Planctomycetes bacterium]|nr:sulfotransferase family protein [Planctomycetota bacterium]